MTNLGKTIKTTGLQSLVDSGKPVGRSGGRPTGRVSKRQWLDMALKILVSDGVAAVRVADLAKRLKVSKSGFYWHFRDRNELLGAMQLYWVDEFSQQTISEALAMEGTLRNRLLGLVRIIREKESGKLDLAFASWAQTDSDVRQLVDLVTELRIDFVKNVLSESGFSGPELSARARLFVVYFSWSEVMFNPEQGGLHGEELDQILDTITEAPNH
jgi:AcrR family transcriptional regulator